MEKTITREPLKVSRSTIILMDSDIGDDWRWDKERNLSMVTLGADCLIEGRLHSQGTLITFDAEEGAVFKIG